MNYVQLNFVQLRMLNNMADAFQARNRDSVDDALKNRMVEKVKENPQNFQAFYDDMYQAMATGKTEEFLEKYGLVEKKAESVQVEPVNPMPVETVMPQENPVTVDEVSGIVNAAPVAQPGPMAFNGFEGVVNTAPVTPAPVAPQAPEVAPFAFTINQGNAGVEVQNNNGIYTANLSPEVKYDETSQNIVPQAVEPQMAPELEVAKVKTLVPNAQKGAVDLSTYLLLVSASASAFLYLSLLYLKVLP